MKSVVGGVSPLFFAINNTDTGYHGQPHYQPPFALYNLSKKQYAIDDPTSSLRQLNLQSKVAIIVYQTPHPCNPSTTSSTDPQHS